MMRGEMFRSDYEEKVASLLTYFKIMWEYETHTFLLKETGEVYTPDFWCPAIGTLIEVKGGRTRERLHKPRLLQDQLNAVAPEDPFFSQKMLSVIVLTPESMWVDCGAGPGMWCNEGAFVRGQCDCGWMITDPHGLWECRYCHQGSKYDDYVYYTWRTGPHVWGKRYDPMMASWTPS